MGRHGMLSTATTRRLGGPRREDRSRRRIRSRRTGPLAAVLLAGILVTAADGGAGPTRGHAVRIGVLAKRGVSRCLQRWTPTATYLEQRIPEYAFAIVPLDFDQVEPAVGAGKVDFVLVNSSLYVRLEARCGVSRIVTLRNERAGLTRFGGVVFCRADRSDIRTFGDLRRKRFVAVDERSFGGW